MVGIITLIIRLIENCTEPLRGIEIKMKHFTCVCDNYHVHT